MRKKNIRQFAILFCGIVLAGLISSKYFFRIDLTAEKRYTLSAETKQVLRQLDAPLYVDIFLDGDLTVQFRKLRNSIREMLDDFKAYSGSRIVYRLIDPAEAANHQEREERYAKLEEFGVRKLDFIKKNKDGSLSQQIIFPGAVLSYKNRQLPVNLFSDNRVQPYEMVFNASLEALEYELIKTVNMLSADSIGRVAFTTGHGELDLAETYDLMREFLNFYHVDRKAINGQLDALDVYKAVIIAKPRTAFDEKDKFVIDRYIMHGGKVMWFVDGADVNTDSLFNTGMTFALALELNLEDQLFTYGVRINKTIVQDFEANEIPVKVDGSSRLVLASWFYYPLVTPSPNHVITRNLNPVWLRYASDIDTVGRDSGIRKSVLLQSSNMSRAKTLPAMISLGEVELAYDRHFNKPHRIAAVLLEGEFPSVFRSRNTRSLFPELQEKQAGKSIHTKMVVVSDGDIARNDIRNTTKRLEPAYPLGFDRYTQSTFANKDFLVNAINYLTDDAGLMNLRNREFKLRLLNKQKVNEEQLKWQMINLVLPMLLLLIGGVAYSWWRRYQYEN
jgi:ABC-2 type transport system permease protein